MIEVRPFSGGEGHGPWLPLDDPRVPRWVGTALTAQTNQGDQDMLLWSGEECWIWRIVVTARR